MSQPLFVRRLARAERGGGCELRKRPPNLNVYRRMPVFGALDAMTGEVPAMITAKKCSGELLDVLRWLLEDVYADRERFCRHLKRSAIHNYYFETVENLEKTIMQAVRKLNRQRNHPLRPHLQSLQALLQVG